jgi:Adenylate and Guanylate cyclase catalytic domain
MASVNSSTHQTLNNIPLWIVADIAGFTAWSSMRDPHQVFTLLESIFQAFDALAKKRGVYKVETIGDCYVGELLRKASTYLQVKSNFLP